MGKSSVVNVLIVGNLWETWRPLARPLWNCQTYREEDRKRNRITLENSQSNPPENSGRSEGTRLLYSECEREREIELPHNASRQRHSSNRVAPRESPVAMRE